MSGETWGVGTSRWKWQHDWAGFSGPLWPVDGKPSQATILGIYNYGYFLDLCLPVLGDVRVGFHTKRGMKNPHMRRHRRRVVLERRPWPADEA